MADQAPPEDVQNSNTGSSAGGADASAGSTPSFPDRLRVHALAKIIGVTSKQVLAKLVDLGIEARSAQSSLDRDVAETVHSAFTAPEDSAAEPVLADPPAVEEPAVDKPAKSKPAVSKPAVAEPTGLFSTEDVAVTTERAPGDRPAFTGPLFLQPEAVVEAPRARRRSKKAAGPAVDTSATDAASEPTGSATAESETVAPVLTVTAAPDTGSSGATDSSDTNKKTVAGDESVGTDDADAESDSSGHDDDGDDDQSQPRRRRRGRRGRGRGRGDQSSDGTSEDGDNDDESQSGSDGQESSAESAAPVSDEEVSADEDSSTDSESSSEDKPSGERRSRRRSRSRGGAKPADSSAEDESTPPAETDAEDSTADASADDTDDDQDESDGSSRRRRRRRRRRSSGETSSDAASSEDDPPNTVVHEREPRNKPRTKDEVQGISGSTRLEAKRQRRRDGRDAGRRRPPILTESEFLARRESVDRVMVVREKSFPDHGGDTTQVAVLEDGVLVEHFVTSSASASMVGNVYLGRVQNVLPSMEAAFIDIGRGRNGVLYAGEVNWDAAGLGGNSRKIEQALKPGDQVLVQVSKDPVGHKGARLTTQLSLAGRYLVYVPGGSSTGISRKLPDTERKRLKEILREIVPAEAGVIIRTAAEGVSEEELARDVTRLQAQWATIEEASAKAESSKGSQPQTLYEEPDLLVKVIRDLFNEDFVKLVIEGEKAWTTTSNYIETVAADMLPKLQRHVVEPGQPDVFEAHRIDEQLAKALDRKVWLPSGGTLVIDRTEAMTVVDVNTGKFTGAGGNLEETVTRNNLEAAEEVVRQMRLRDIGGMIVVDFIDMVLEQNRDLVLRRLTEALGRDRTRHQVSEVTSLGLVQMTRKKLGTGLVEAFSTNCEHCQGRGIIVHPFPVESKPDDGSKPNSSRGDSSTPRKRRGRDKSDNAGSGGSAGAAEHSEPTADPSIKRAHPVALAMAAHHDDVVADVTPADVIDNGVIDNGAVDNGADAATVSTPRIIGASEVAAAQGNSPQDSHDENTTDSSSAPADTASATESSEVPARRAGRSGRRKASRPAATAPAAATAETAVDVPADLATDVAVDAPTDAAAEVPANPADDAPQDSTPQDSTPPDSTGSDAVSGSAASEDPPEPVVKARRGRRVARKAAAPAAEAPDAGTVFVIPATSEAGTDADESAPTPVTAPAFTQVDSAEAVQEAPVTKPRRRRAAARPAGPPVDA
ncbi:MAG: translation initiation factor IF-2 N-terminal domain-containing protein [Rhodococcus sp. (in: high G+C Gram-positive bacteria)]|uniref:translation initiation factor IF-2 N-terminal domain-containing protein n=1 Tax=Rhodococcus sp. EPR-157 TaxID=1813677 RepID=UPI0007BBCD60|nr:translation initiation factor IF-2 N-terminal domain-containing protein [Rhodococcus sp. EPR-157]KZF01996.1 ribonuclease E [Rhodococcus sp. EPR-157]